MPDLIVSAGRFGVAGLISTATHATVFFLLLGVTEMRPPVATVIAFLCALLIGYRLHHSWTFEVEAGHRRYFTRFALIAVVGSGLNFLIMKFMTGAIGASPWVGLVAVIGIVAPLSFLASRYWGFR